MMGRIALGRLCAYMRRPAQASHTTPLNWHRPKPLCARGVRIYCL
jgi:hypothetical protein